ncbi:MAG TPA: stage III sporulation protein AF [Firmicutes bacterium]|nr:stage III sporulation protein AF [Bacillota bacterium]
MKEMLSTVGELIRYIVILIFLAALLEMILPQGVFRRYLRVFVGILLVLTLLNPIQKIMRIAPYWEMPVIEGVENNRELELILQRGEKIYRDSMEKVPQEYHQRIFQLLKNELSREFSQDLVQLEVGMEENTQSRDFGVLTDIAVVTRDLQPAAINKATRKVEKIKISVDAAEKVTEKVKEKIGGLFTTGIPDEESYNRANGDLHHQTVPGSSRQAGVEEIRRYLSAYFSLPVENVHVTILP